MKSHFSFGSFASGIVALSMLTVAASANAQQIFYDDFESGDKNHTENGVRWTSAASVSMVSNFGSSGSHSLRFRFAGVPAGQDSFAEQRFDLGKAYNEIVVEWSAYYPNGLDGRGVKFVHRRESPGNNKFIRLWRGNKADGNNGYTQFKIKAGASTDSSGTILGDERIFGEYGSMAGATNQTGVGPNGSSGTSASAGSFTGYLTDLQRGRWLKMKVRAKVATSATSNDGIIEIWRDGVLLSSAKNLPLAPGDSGGGFDFGYLMGWANSGFDQTTDMYIDDVKISASNTAVVTPMPPASISVQ